MKRVQTLMGVLGVLAGCGGGNPYGYARTYQLYGNEGRYAQRASQEVLYDDLVRMPDRFQRQEISWFGVVTRVGPTASGETLISLQQRTHQERHLCEDEAESSCRVTVSETPGGAFSAHLRLTPSDAEGENRIQVGALLRVYGTPEAGQYDPQGGPVLRADFYRHWPRGQFVTTAARATWRR